MQLRRDRTRMAHAHRLTGERKGDDDVSAPAASEPAATEPPAASPHLSRRRRIVIWALVVLGSVVLLVSILTLWVERQVLDNGSWKHASQRPSQRPKVQDTLAVY